MKTKKKSPNSKSVSELNTLQKKTKKNHSNEFRISKLEIIFRHKRYGEPRFNLTSILSPPNRTNPICRVQQSVSVTVYNVIQNKTSNTILIITTLYLRFIYIFGLLTSSV